MDGLGRPCSWKVEHILEMVFLTVPAARVLKASLENLPSLTAVAKEQMRRFHWHLLNLSRKGSWERKKLIRGIQSIVCGTKLNLHVLLP